MSNKREELVSLMKAAYPAGNFEMQENLCYSLDEEKLDDWISMLKSTGIKKGNIEDGSLKRRNKRTNKKIKTP